MTVLDLQQMTDRGSNDSSETSLSDPQAWRPLKAPARWVNALVLWAIAFSPFIGDAKRRHNDWEKRFEAIKARATA